MSTNLAASKIEVHGKVLRRSAINHDQRRSVEQSRQRPIPVGNSEFMSLDVKS
jgi:hypothetical protein